MTTEVQQHFHIQAPGWGHWFNPFLQRSEMAELCRKVQKQYEITPCAPAYENIFRGFQLCDYNDVRVVIFGQDPYHTPGVANGLAFAVSDETPVPPSLANMFTELRQSMSYTHFDKTLVPWAQQGVLLLNTTLTVRCGEAQSHKNLGWEDFMNFVVGTLLTHPRPLIWLLLGKPAQALLNGYIPQRHHHVIRTAHPSPLAAHKGFFGSNCFRRINERLIWLGEEPIQWGQ